MSLLPFFLKIEGRRVLVAGAGNVAREKIAALLRAGARLTVIAPQACAEVRQWAEANDLVWKQKAFAREDLEGCLIAIAATDDPAVNADLYQAAGERGILANSVDDPPNCDFYFGSVVARGALQVAISTAGESPALAQQLRQEIDAQLPEDLGPWLEQMGALRREVLAAHPAGEARRLLLHQLIQRQICESPDCPTRQMALAREVEEESGENQVYGDLPEAGWNSPAVARTEKVWLVGAGPGNADLLTVKAVKLIQTADVILHDDLVSQAILDLASPSAQVIHVGKRCGEKHIHQEEIHRLMIGHAREGRSVVRLKGGDPMLFGRANEELAALREARIPAEVVPGITAAMAAAASAGCSLTERGGASAVVLTTGHRAQESAQLPAESGMATRVVYMPGRDLAQIAHEWLREGLPAELPCVLVSRASLPDESMQRTTLGELDSLAPLAAPSLLLAGWSVGKAGDRG